MGDDTEYVSGYQGKNHDALFPIDRPGEIRNL
jgi:hypothetical protein